MEEARSVQLALVFAELPDFPESLLELLATFTAHATFAVAPDVLVRAASSWRAAIADGNELANGALIGATVDGSIENWPPKALCEELDEVDRLLSDLGQEPVVTGYLPGAEHFSADGAYREFFESRFDICLAETAKAVEVAGNSLQIIEIDDGISSGGLFALLSRGAIDDLEPLSRLVSRYRAVSMSEMRATILGSQ